MQKLNKKKMKKKLIIKGEQRKEIKLNLSKIGIKLEGKKMKEDEEKMKKEED